MQPVSGPEGLGLSVLEELNQAQPRSLCHITVGREEEKTATVEAPV